MKSLDLIYEWLLGKGYGVEVINGHANSGYIIWKHDELRIYSLGAFEFYVRFECSRSGEFETLKCKRTHCFDIRDREFFSKLDEALTLIQRGRGIDRGLPISPTPF